MMLVRPPPPLASIHTTAPPHHPAPRPPPRAQGPHTLRQVLVTPHHAGHMHTGPPPEGVQGTHHVGVMHTACCNTTHHPLHGTVRHLQNSQTHHVQSDTPRTVRHTTYSQTHTTPHTWLLSNPCRRSFSGRAVPTASATCRSGRLCDHLKYCCSASCRLASVEMTYGDECMQCMWR